MGQASLVITGRHIAESTPRKLIGHILEFAVYEEVVLAEEVTAREIANDYVNGSASTVNFIYLLAKRLVKQSLIDSFANVLRDVLFVFI